MGRDSGFEVLELLDDHGMYAGDRPGVYMGVGLDSLDTPEARLGNPDLPIYKYRDEIVDAVRDHSVVIISAEPGAGKSTQLPQFFLEAGFGTTYVTQPRRAAAYNVAERITDEITDTLGDLAGEYFVSIQHGGHKRGPDNARIKILTDGLQLRKDLGNPYQPGDVRMIDEVHEMNANIELEVADVAREVAENPGVRVVLSSASMDTERLADHFEAVLGYRPPIIHVEGRTHKVEFIEMPTSTITDEVVDILQNMPDEDGELPVEPHGILVFEPGKREIQDTINEISRRLPKSVAHKVKIFPLHAKLSQAQQQAALTEYPDTIKIVVATEVAQTSLTIPDIGYVVDSGLKRQIEIDKDGTPCLKLVAIPQSDCYQRMGRVGRVSNGVYRLTRRNRHTPYRSYATRPEFPVAEIQRTDLSRSVLMLKGVGIDIEEFNLFNTAPAHNIELANKKLVGLGAMDDEGELTHIGIQMTKFPLNVHSARSMVESLRFNDNVRRMMAAIAACEEAGGLQRFMQNAGKEWEQLTDQSESDLLAQLDLFIAAQSMTFEDVRDHDMDIDNINRAQEQFRKIVRLAGTTDERLEAPTLQEYEDLLHCISSGWITNVYRHIGGGEYVDAFQSSRTPREISNRSVVNGMPGLVIGRPYRIDLTDGQETIPKHCIESVTATTARALGSVAAKHVVTTTEDFILRDGKFYELRRDQLWGLPITDAIEVPAVPSEELRQRIIAYAIEHKGHAQKYLNEIKKELEYLGRRTKSYVPQLTQVRLLGLIEEVATPDITTPAQIENGLRELINDRSRKLELDDFISEERRQEILRDAPDQIEVDAGDDVMKIQLRYDEGDPIAKQFSKRKFLQLRDEVYLPDGRQVMFTWPNTSRKFTVHGLRMFLEDEGR